MPPATPEAAPAAKPADGRTVVTERDVRRVIDGYDLDADRWMDSGVDFLVGRTPRAVLESTAPEDEWLRVRLANRLLMIEVGAFT